MDESLHVWDKVQALRDQRKALEKSINEDNAASVRNMIATIDDQLPALIAQLSKTDKKVLKLWEKQKALKTENPQLADLLKIERYTLKLGKHIQHLQRLDERQDSHFHRLKSRVAHLSSMVEDYDQKYRNQ